ncbi:hypothetical protein DJ568_05050 [Mucilaginibacter hurinus]|uniref:FecR family protein n=1 Tax=Mucilaginibacter hurinus TaxID=2201324 RepID=A0A367GSP9_9SPHI|nr:FecR family protein [Mucilaginibacter hurinus]RCH56115.1 hypothetical protein DJ568_05050 [Mucilaginibacter hurinus]
MDKGIPTALLDKYLKGTCSAEEELIVREWYNSFVNDDDQVSSYTNAEKVKLQFKIKQAIESNIELLQKTNPEGVTTSKFSIKRLSYAVTGIAAMLVIAVGLVLLNAQYKPATGVSAPLEMVNIVNNTKIIQEQILSDGSHVWLYPGAKISFPKLFTGNTREVTMSGASFFDVAKNAAKPFIIYSEHMVTKVWGTSFRVRDSKASGFADVTVVTGKVSVKSIKSSEDKIEEVMLHPNEQVTYIKQKEILNSKKRVRESDLDIWKKINLSFDNAPIKTVIPVLNRHYNVNIVSTDEKLDNYLLNADFNGLNFVSVMEILRKTLNVSYEINNTNIILKNNN